MSTESETDENKTSSGLTYNQVIIIGFIFVILVGIGFMIKDKNLRISYIMIVGLGLFTLFNISMTIKYYTKLRNSVGKQGPQGPKGPQGPEGEPGVCTFAEKCGMDDPNSEVINEIENRNAYRNLFKNDNEYKAFITFLKNSDESTIQDLESRDIMIETKKLVDEIIIQAKNTKIDKDDFFNLVLPLD